MSTNFRFLKQLKKEDFDKKDQTLIAKLGQIFNPAIQQISTIFNHGLKISDLNVQQKTLTFSVDSTGTPVSSTSFTSSLSGNCTMIQVGRAQNITNPTTYPTGGHSVSFTQNGTQIYINNITGLTTSDSWQITLIAYV